MPDEAAAEQTTSDATAQNTGSAAAEIKQEPSGTTQTGTTEDAKDKPKTFTQADVDRLIARTKKEEKAKLDDQIKKAELTETEQLKTEKAELEQKLRSRDAGDAIEEAARKANSANPKAVVRLAQAIGLEFDKDGKLVNLKDLITEAKEIAPELFPARPGPANGADGNSGKESSVGHSMNDVIRQAAGRK